MELDLTPKVAKEIYGGDGGAYYAWSPSELPMLREGNIGAGKLSLVKNGFALPRYSDSAKVAYVLQGMFRDPLSLIDDAIDFCKADLSSSLFNFGFEIDRAVFIRFYQVF